MFFEGEVKQPERPNREMDFKVLVRWEDIYICIYIDHLYARMYKENETNVYYDCWNVVYCVVVCIFLLDKSKSLV